MSPPLPLGPEALRRRSDPSTLPFETTAEAEELLDILGQERAVEAVRFGIAIRSEGYNVFAIGPPGTGKQTLVRQFLDRRAEGETTPPDWCYVHNFADPRRPRALRLPPGTGVALRDGLARVVAELRVALPAAFESEEHRTRRQKVVRAVAGRRDAGFAAVQERARQAGVAVLRTESGVMVAPTREGRMLEPEEFRGLPRPEQERLESAMASASQDLAALFAQVHEWEHAQRDELAALDLELARGLVGERFRELAARHAGQTQVLDYLGEVERDMLAHTDDFQPAPDGGAEAVLRQVLRRAPPDGSGFRRYQVNVVVDRDAERGAPVVVEDRPTLPRLVGRVEHLAEFGALLADFTLIRAGALHRADGGYLLLDALELLRQPGAWDALKHALRAREVRIESLGQQLGMAATVSLEPEPIPLENLKVLLVGDRPLYYLLSAADAEFLELFKVVADFEEAIERGPESELLYARLLGTIARRERLRPLDRVAVAAVLEHAARLAADQAKLSVRMRPVADLLREADFLAAAAGREVTTGADVEAAIAAQLRRAGRVRDRLLEAIRREVLLVATDGRAVGQVNGLSVLSLGEHSFGHPVRITARARAGRGEVVDIEREVELGGPIHSKGVFILSGFLGARYAQEAPLSLSASLVFEQSYGPVEGDSASLAELCALLSALSGLPLAQSLAVTGSVNQAGGVQAVGGVNEKIEGFFDACRERGAAEGQGVLLPAANVQHLMLRQDVVEAVAAGRFRVVPVESVDGAMELLTGTPAGERDERGEFPADSVNGRVEARLAKLAEGVRALGQGAGAP
jgi:lon-related putative ATP-dependent protease